MSFDGAEESEFEIPTDWSAPFRLDQPRRVGSLILLDDTWTPGDDGTYGANIKIVTLDQHSNSIRPVGVIGRRAVSGGIDQMFTTVSIVSEISDEDAELLAAEIIELSHQSAARLPIAPPLRIFTTACRPLARALDRRDDVHPYVVFAGRESLDDDMTQTVSDGFDNLIADIEDNIDDPDEVGEIVREITMMLGNNASQRLGVVGGLTPAQLLDSVRAAKEEAIYTINQLDGPDGPVEAFANMSNEDVHALASAREQQFLVGQDEEIDLTDARRLIEEAFKN